MVLVCSLSQGIFCLYVYKFVEYSRSPKNSGVVFQRIVFTHRTFGFQNKIFDEYWLKHYNVTVFGESILNYEIKAKEKTNSDCLVSMLRDDSFVIKTNAWSRTTISGIECVWFITYFHWNSLLHLVMITRMDIGWGVHHTGHFWHHPSACPIAIVWKVVGQINIIPNNFTGKTGCKVWCDQSMRLIEYSYPKIHIPIS